MHDRASSVAAAVPGPRTGPCFGARLRRTAGRLLLAMAALPAFATAQEQPLWELGLGVGALRVPHYRGSDQDHGWVLPVPYFVYNGEVLKANREGAHALLFERDSVELELSLTAGLPAHSKDDDARRGMDDLAPTVELGPSLNWSLARGADWKLELRVPVRAALTVESQPRMIGWTSTPNLRLGLRPGGDWALGLQAGPVWGSRGYNGHYYDVPREDARPERPAFQSAAGWGGAQATGTLRRRFGRFWTGAFLRYDTLHGAVFDDSPLVQRHENLSFGVALSWVFAASSRRGAEEEAP